MGSRQVETAPVPKAVRSLKVVAAAKPKLVQLPATSLRPKRAGSQVKQSRAQVMEALPAVLKALIAGAKKGSLPHVKLLLEMAGLGKGSLGRQGRKAREKSLETVLLEEWERQGVGGRGEAAGKKT